MGVASRAMAVAALVAAMVIVVVTGLVVGMVMVVMAVVVAHGGAALSAGGEGVIEWFAAMVGQ